MKTFVTIATFPVSLSMSQTGVLDQLEGLATTVTNQTALSTASVAGLSQDQMVHGLKEALGKGVQVAVSDVGGNDGFLANVSVKIPMPGKLQSVEKTLRSLHQENSPMNLWIQ